MNRETAREWLWMVTLLAPVGVAVVCVTFIQVVLWRYRRTLLRLMMTHARPGGALHDAAPVPADEPRHPVLVAPMMAETGGVAPLNARMRAGVRDAERAHRTAAAFAVGALFLTVVLPLALFLGRRAGLEPVRDGAAPDVASSRAALTGVTVAVSGLVGLAWPFPLAARLFRTRVASPGPARRVAARLLAVLAAGLLYAGGWALIPWMDARKVSLDPLVLAVLVNLLAVTSVVLLFALVFLGPASLLLAVTAGRSSVRGVAPLASAACCAGLYALPAAYGAYERAGTGAAVLAGAVVGLGAPAAFLSAVTRLYVGKRISERQALVASFVVVCYCAWQGSALSLVVLEATKKPPALPPAAVTLAGAACLVAVLLVPALYLGAYAALIRRGNVAAAPVNLLLLRVFGDARRSESLFDALALHWRHVGTIQFIAGPDLAAASADPHKLLDFFGGRLKDRFVAGPADLAARWDARDLDPDPDGRYRLNEFFCHDDTWRAVLERLVGESDLVLMDLRGFCPARQGCVFELHRLADLMPLGRVVLLVDGSTDEPFLLQMLDAAWDARSPASPNAGGGAARPHLLRLPARTDARDTAALLEQLAEAAGVSDSRAARTDRITL